MDIGESSQFASALLLCATLGQWQIGIDGEGGAKSPYVAMTTGLIEAFPSNGGRLAIEPDASGGSYFWAAGHILSADGGRPVTVARWPGSGWQIDAEFPAKLPLSGSISRQDDLGDSIMTAIAIAPLAKRPVQFTELGRLRVQECERVNALRTGLINCGAAVVESGDHWISPLCELTARRSKHTTTTGGDVFRYSRIESAGLSYQESRLRSQDVPHIFPKNCCARSQGLGATMLDERGSPLELDQLAAD
ncbi:MAG: hypothetical protein CM1200mP29_15320 [Verrucomicrobiota bacterium]|nr:MAG: hypothetical protein CM1200mP29_15320 [Verrucomicrobiota bacterium]